MYGAAVVGDGLILDRLPVSGGGTGLVGGLLLASVLNLLIVAAGAPVAGIVVRRLRADLPVFVARDYAARGLILVLAGFLALLGIGNRPEADAERRALSEQAVAVRGYVESQAPASYRREIDLADTLEVEPNLFRTCVPGGDSGRWLCVFVDTTEDPPGVTVDPSREPNSTFVGSDGGPGG
jgi:hypothetical protein